MTAGEVWGEEGIARRGRLSFFRRGRGAHVGPDVNPRDRAVVTNYPDTVLEAGSKADALPSTLEPKLVSSMESIMPSVSTSPQARDWHRTESRIQTPPVPSGVKRGTASFTWPNGSDVFCPVAGIERVKPLITEPEIRSPETVRKNERPRSAEGCAVCARARGRARTASRWGVALRAPEHPYMTAGVRDECSATECWRRWTETQRAYVSESRLLTVHCGRTRTRSGFRIMRIVDRDVGRFFSRDRVASATEFRCAGFDP